MTKLNQKGMVPVILIVAGVIIILAVLATLFKFSSAGSSKNTSNETTQAAPTPTAIAQAALPTPFPSTNSEIVDPGDACDSKDEVCTTDGTNGFSGEGDNVKASDLDGDS